MNAGQHGGINHIYYNTNMSGPQRPPPPPYQPQMQKQQQHTEFTPEMRDRQARGKDPYSVHEDASRPGGPRGAESFEVVQKRRVAAQMLDTPELLMMDAQRVDDSIPATRLRYTRMLCGMDQPPQHGSSSSAAQSSSRQAHGSSSKSRTHTPSKRQNSGGK